MGMDKPKSLKADLPSPENSTLNSRPLNPKPSKPLNPATAQLALQLPQCVHRALAQLTLARPGPGGARGSLAHGFPGCRLRSVLGLLTTMGY